MTAAVKLTPEELAATWALRLLDKPLDDADAERFQRWLSADETHPVLFDAALAVWEEAGAQATDPGMVHLRRAALHDFSKARQRRTRGWSRRWLVGGLAAAVVGAVALGISLSGRPVLYATEVGERRLVQLSDGSAISLDADTRVRVAYGSERRSLVLERGRAKFTVAKDAMRPFSVDAGGAVVVATGTAFSVERLASEVRLLLYEGSVSVLRKEGPMKRLQPVLDRAGTPAEKMLRGGRQLSVAADGSGSGVSSFDPVRATAWEAGSLVFSDEPLETAVARVNRYTDKPIRIGDPGAARTLVNGVFTAGDTAAFIEGVTATHSLRSVRGEGETVISSVR